MAGMTAESALISTQAQHLVELSEAANNDTKLIVLLGFPRSALQTSDALKQQVTLIDVV